MRQREGGHHMTPKPTAPPLRGRFSFHALRVLGVPPQCCECIQDAPSSWPQPGSPCPTTSMPTPLLAAPFTDPPIPPDVKPEPLTLQPLLCLNPKTLPATQIPCGDVTMVWESSAPLQGWGYSCSPQAGPWIEGAKPLHYALMGDFHKDQLCRQTPALFLASLVGHGAGRRASLKASR